MKNLGFFYSFFFELLLKFSDFVKSDDFIGKFSSKYIRSFPVFIEKNYSKSIFFTE